MKAFTVTARDTQPAVQDLPQPEPAADEVLVGVEAATVNGFDISVAAGYVFDLLPHEFPIVLGRDFVGTVTAVGDRVTDIAVGDRVAGVIPGADLGPRTGTFAEHVSTPATAVTRIPEGIEAQQAAVIGLAGVAAHDALEALDVQPGETVLVSGATGGAGSVALQLAREAGATVIATARPGEEEEYVRGLGAQHTVDWSADLTATVRNITADGVDKALHFAGDAASIGQLVRSGGAVASTLGATPEALGRDDITLAAIMATATADKLAHLLGLVADGKVRVNIEATVPLDRAQEALDLFTNGTLGKVLITR
jgi:NADPH:quinone reductase-like Zn-dependent oxidoreductase